jgi:hypothetical protein
VGEAAEACGRDWSGHFPERNRTVGSRQQLKLAAADGTKWSKQTRYPPLLKRITGLRRTREGWSSQNKSASEGVTAAFG